MDDLAQYNAGASLKYGADISMLSQEELREIEARARVSAVASVSELQSWLMSKEASKENGENTKTKR